jgi:hypothetical protein
MNAFAVSGLVKRHAELAGEIERPRNPAEHYSEFPLSVQPQATD